MIHATPVVKGYGVIAAFFRLLRSLPTEVSQINSPQLRVNVQNYDGFR